MKYNTKKPQNMCYYYFLLSFKSLIPNSFFNPRMFAGL